MFPREKIMVEVLEDVEPDEQVIRACQDMVQDGYRIALDDFCYKSHLQPLNDLAKIVKIDFTVHSIGQVKKQMDQLAVHNVKLLAGKVENHEAFQLASKMGFEYFPGVFLLQAPGIGRQGCRPIQTESPAGHCRGEQSGFHD
jgi:EAL and modified HD-GYP domain-containing signal transduction protein